MSDCNFLCSRLHSNTIENMGFSLFKIQSRRVVKRLNFKNLNGIRAKSKITMITTFENDSIYVQM